MSKITSGYRVTIPKALAERLGVRPGDEVEWQVNGDVVRRLDVGLRRRQRLD